jgi:HEAT repeat protein
MIRSLRTNRTQRLAAWIQSAAAVAALAVLAPLAGCEGGPEEGKEAEYYGKIAADPKAKTSDRESAIKHLEGLNDKAALPFLYEVLAGDKASLKPKIPAIIQRVGDEGSVGALIKGIDYKAGMGTDKNARAAANTNEAIAKALGRLAPKNDEKVSAALERLADSNHLNTQLAAIVALGRMESKHSAQFLIDTADGHTHNFIVKNAVIALGDIAAPEAVPVLIKMLFFERKGASFYRESSYALFQIGKPAVDALVDVYNGKYAAIDAMHVAKGVQKAKALQVLSDIGGDPRIEKLCIEAAGIPANDTAQTLARTFGTQCVGKLGLGGGTKALLQIWDDNDQSIAEHALYALSQLGETEVARQLLNMTTFDGWVKQCMSLDKRNKTEVCEAASPQVRPPRVTALGRMAPPDMAGAFDSMIKEEEARKVEGEMSKFQKTLVKKLKEGREMIAAAEACKGKGETCWVETLKHDNPRYRERAGYELLWLGSKRSKAANDALLEALADQDNEARYAAILAVWRSLPEGGAEKVDAILEREKGKTQFVRINEDLKRIQIKLRRGY